MDTSDFNALTPEEYKNQARANWTAEPCGSHTSSAELLSAEFFKEIEEYRYGLYPWLLDCLDNLDVAGKETLEVGYGMGSDHINLARRGAVLRGIDLSPEHMRICGHRMKMSGFQTDLRLCDAENMVFGDESFDFVYSFGVAHHSPDTQRIIQEVYRVLRPGGKCFIAVYHKNSIFFWWSVFLFNYLLLGGFRKRTLKQQISLVEYPGDNENLVVRLFARREFENLFSAFSERKSCVRHLVPAEIRLFGKLFKSPNKPRPWLMKIGERFGWYVIVEATK